MSSGEGIGGWGWGAVSEMQLYLIGGAELEGVSGEESVPRDKL